ncbi:hypothetical protein [Ramlibacter henchirensis]|nr:hypothetical protein [Ramlibacter henchirensis]
MEETAELLAHDVDMAHEELFGATANAATASSRGCSRAAADCH